MLLRMRHYIIFPLALITLTALLVGCGGGAIGSMLKIVGLEALLPDEWKSTRNMIRIVADIITDQPLREVIAHVTRASDTEVTEVVLTQNAEGKYEGSIEVPATETETTYTAVVEATNSSGAQVTSEPIQIETPPVAEEPAAVP